MKLTRKKLKQLIETFIAGPEGRAIDMGHYALKRSSHNLETLLDTYAEKIINHQTTIKYDYSEKFKQLFSTNNVKDKLSAFMIAKTLKIISNDEHNEIKKIVKDIKRLESAKDLKKNPPKGMAIGYPGKKVYRSEEGTMTDKKYAADHAQRDDPSFDARLSQRIREMIPDFEVFIDGVYQNYGDPAVYDTDLINYIVRTVTKMIEQRYGKIYTSGNILPTIEKILYSDFNIKDIVLEMSGKREEYGEFLDLTDLPHDLDEILSEIYEDTPVDDVLKQLKDIGYDENFYKESFQAPDGNYLKADFDPDTYQEMMIYYIHDRLSHEDHINEIGASDGILYRMR